MATNGDYGVQQLIEALADLGIEIPPGIHTVPELTLALKSISANAYPSTPEEREDEARKREAEYNAQTTPSMLSGLGGKSHFPSADHLRAASEARRRVGKVAPKLRGGQRGFGMPG
jgi:hypothetical protein